MYINCPKCSHNKQSISTSCGTKGDGVGTRMHYVICHRCQHKGPRRFLAEDARRAWNAQQETNVIEQTKNNNAMLQLLKWDDIELYFRRKYTFNSWKYPQQSCLEFAKEVYEFMVQQQQHS